MHINWLLIDNADTQSNHFSTKSDSIRTQHETTNRVEPLHILAVSSSAGIVQIRSRFVGCTGHLSCQGYPEGLCAEHQLLGQS